MEQTVTNLLLLFLLNSYAMYENIHVCMCIYVYVCIICESLCMCAICLIKSPVVQYWHNKAGTAALCPPSSINRVSLHKT